MVALNGSSVSLVDSPSGLRCLRSRAVVPPGLVLAVRHLVGQAVGFLEPHHGALRDEHGERHLDNEENKSKRQASP